MFRTQTARRILAVADQVVQVYLEQRPAWMEPYPLPSTERLLSAVRLLGNAVVLNDVATYRAYTATQWEAVLRTGAPPVAVLEMAEVFYRAVLRFLTPDQQALVREVIGLDERPWRETVRDMVDRQTRGEDGQVSDIEPARR